MFWSLSFHLLSDETVIEDSNNRKKGGIKPAYSVFLTNKRAIFRFDGLGSSLTQSFFYHDILDAQPDKRLFVNYIKLKTAKREFLLNTADAQYWSEKIMSVKESLKESLKEAPVQQNELFAASPKGIGKNELIDMLAVLKKNELLTEQEFEEKVQMLDSMNSMKRL